MDKLISQLDIVDYFRKRTVCIQCGQCLIANQSVCHQCPDSQSKHIATILDANVSALLTTIVTRLSSEIQNYKKIIAGNAQQAPYDVPFGRQYQKLLVERADENLLSLIIHIDGISLVKSTKLKLWLCSASIIEVPPRLRTQRQNIALLSMYIGSTEPDVKMWLRSCLNDIQQLKEKGKNCH